MAAETLYEKFMSVVDARDTTVKAVLVAIEVSPSSFYKWKKDNNDASDNFLKKVRAFTESPEQFLQGVPVAQKTKKRQVTKKSGKSDEVSVELLEALAGMQPSDLEYVIQIVKVMGVPLVSVQQITQLIELRDGKSCEE